jgi:sarcosine oxidase, subunit gamma
MADAAPAWHTALHDLDLTSRAKPVDRSCGVWANEMPASGFISLRGKATDTTFATAVARVTGVPLPVQPCTFAASGPTEILWLSQDEWLVAVPLHKTKETCDALTRELASVRHQVVDNSGGFTQIALLGPNARDALSHCTVYDIEHLEAGQLVGTTFGKLTAFLRTTQTGYTILVRRSYAGYVWAFLERAAQPYGFGVATLT